jgi:hypothetical protein
MVDHMTTTADKPSQKRARRDEAMDTDAPFGGIKRLSAPVAKALAAFTFGTHPTVAGAARAGGCTREALSRALRRDDVVARATALVKQSLRGPTAIIAARRLTQLIHSPSEEVSLKASSAIAESAGLIGTADPRGATAGAVPLLTIVFKHQAVAGAPAIEAPEATITVAPNAAPPMIDYDAREQSREIAARVAKTLRGQG